MWLELTSEGRSLWVRADEIERFGWDGGNFVWLKSGVAIGIDDEVVEQIRTKLVQRGGVVDLEKSKAQWMECVKHAP